MMDIFVYNVLINLVESMVDLLGLRRGGVNVPLKFEKKSKVSSSTIAL